MMVGRKKICILGGDGSGDRMERREWRRRRSGMKWIWLSGWSDCEEDDGICIGVSQ